MWYNEELGIHDKQTIRVRPHRSPIGHEEKANRAELSSITNVIAGRVIPGMHAYLTTIWQLSS